MNLLSDEVHWIFLSGSDEERFLQDIHFGLECLLYRGVNIGNIQVCIDQEPDFISIYEFPPNIKVSNINNLRELVTQNAANCLVVVVTGHGGNTGITTTTSVISPSDLISLIRESDHLKKSLIILGQCFAGIFNYLEVRSLSPETKEVLPPEICIIGATDLDISVSLFKDTSDISLSNSSFSISLLWRANLFLYFFFLYILEPVDIDGDGKFSVTDAYKYASIGTNNHLNSTKKSYFLNVYFKIVEDVLISFDKSKSNEDRLTLSEKSLQDFDNLFTGVLVNQNPWILNANFSRTLEINTIPTENSSI
jgi:hypothetical protein